MQGISRLSSGQVSSHIILPLAFDDFTFQSCSRTLSTSRQIPTSRKQSPKRGKGTVVSFNSVVGRTGDEQFSTLSLPMIPTAFQLVSVFPRLHKLCLYRQSNVINSCSIDSGGEIYCRNHANSWPNMVTHDRQPNVHRRAR